MQCIHALANGNEYALVLVIVLILLTCCLSLLYGKGFVFSENEHTALEQFEGGPCAVIAPVQV